MASKRRIRIDRVIILILSGLLVGGGIGFGIYKLIDLFKVEEKPIVNVETNEGTRVSLNDYTVYYDDTNDLGFNFIIAQFNFSSNTNITYDLGSLSTSEKIVLDDVDKYINKLDTDGYDLNSLNIASGNVISDTNSVDAYILIPYTTDANSLTLYNAANNSDKINIDLTRNIVAATSLKLANKNEEITVGSTSVYVSKAYISTFMLHNDEPYEISSSSRMYSFEISVKQASDNIKISDAIFIKKGTSEEIHCKNSDYKAIDMDNILNTNLTLGNKGGLFFDVYSDLDVVEDGTLLIKFSNSDTWVEISTTTE